VKALYLKVMYVLLALATLVLASGADWQWH